MVWIHRIMNVKYDYLPPSPTDPYQLTPSNSPAFINEIVGINLVHALNELVDLLLTVTEVTILSKVLTLLGQTAQWG